MIPTLQGYDVAAGSQAVRHRVLRNPYLLLVQTGMHGASGRLYNLQTKSIERSGRKNAVKTAVFTRP